MSRPVWVFVGHSFATEDEAIVGYFTKHLEQLREMGLEWFDARPGAVGSTQTKVMAAIDRANVFLGIFTRKWPLRGKMGSEDGRAVLEYFTRLRRGPTYWAGSAWTFQESGYALAKGHDVIFLVEKGIADLGGLQADISVIEFNRSALGAALGELTGQLSNILSRRIPLAVQSLPVAEGVRVAVPKESSSTTEEPASEGGDTPGAKSNLDAYVRMMKALSLPAPDLDAAAKALADAESAAETDDERDFLRVDYANGLIRCGVSTGHDLLVERASGRPSRRTLSALGQRFLYLGEHEKGLDLLQKAVEANGGSPSRAVVVKSLAETMSRLGRAEEGRKALLSATHDASLEGWERNRLFLGLADLAKEEGALEEEIAWLEMAVSATPEDTDPRFRLAFLCAEHDRNEQALWHYRVLERERAGEGVLNNLGVAYFALGMPVHGVSAYKAGTAKGGSLAMANQADKLAEAGYHGEALELLKKAMAQPDVHGFVGDVRQRMDQVEEREAEQIRAVEKSAEEQRRFYRDYAAGMQVLEGGPAQVAGVWHTRHGDLAVVASGERIVGSAELPGKTSDLGGGGYDLFAATILGEEPKVVVRVRWEGALRGASGQQLGRA